MKDKKKKNSKYLVDGFFDYGDLDDAMGTSPSGGREALFLGRFNSEAILTIMKEAGLSGYLAKKGYGDFLLKVGIDDSRVSSLRLYFGDEDPGNLMIDLRMSETKFIPDTGKGGSPPVYDMILTEWLSARDPLRKEFDDTKPRLPGQTHPGLGVLKYCFRVMFILAKEVFKDGFMDVPDHMHGAIMYSRMYMFYDPVHEGILKAIMRDLSGYSLSDISWGMLTKTIIEVNSGNPQDFSPSEQICPVSERMKGYFHSREYRERFKEVFRKKRYRFDYEEMVRKRKELSE